MPGSVHHLIERRVFAAALRALAASRGGEARGTAAALYASLLTMLPEGAKRDPAMPTCAAHLDHLMRELSGMAQPFPDLAVAMLPYRAGWTIRAPMVAPRLPAPANARQVAPPPPAARPPYPAPAAPRPAPRPVAGLAPVHVGCLGLNWNDAAALYLSATRPPTRGY